MFLGNCSTKQNKKFSKYSKNPIQESCTKKIKFCTRRRKLIFFGSPCIFLKLHIYFEKKFHGHRRAFYLVSNKSKYLQNVKLKLTVFFNFNVLNSMLTKTEKKPQI